MVRKSGGAAAERDPAVGGSAAAAGRSLGGGGGGGANGLVILDDMLFADAQLAMLELGVRAPQDVQLAVQVTAGASPASLSFSRS